MATLQAEAPLGTDISGRFCAENPPASIRLLGPDHLDLFRNHLLRLSPACRNDRYGMPVGDRFIRQYVTTTCTIGSNILAFMDGQHVRGSVELRPMGDHKTAEITLSVEKPWRCQGMGTQLMQNMLIAARNQGVQQIYFRFLAGNLAMKSLAAKFTTDMTLDEMDVVGQINPISDPAPRPRGHSFKRDQNWLQKLKSAILS